MDDDALQAAYAKRRDVLGDDYVDSVTAETDPTAVEFQDYLTATAWGAWAREGALSTRDRSLLVLAMTATLGRMEEFRLHAAAAPRAGVTDAEIDELLFQLVAYAGAPAGVSARARHPRVAVEGRGLTVATVGFVGLGNMGSALAANLVGSGHTVVGHDAAGADRAPDGVTHVDAVADVARAATVVVCSLPDGTASEAVAAELAAANDGITTHVVDTSTVGVAAARAIDARLAEAGIAYVDAPVSGGVAGARARTLAVMYSASDDACAEVDAVLAGLSDVRHRVGDRPGLAQAMKLANNFLSATALVATSEAVAFGVAEGLDMATMLDVLNGASGRSAASSDKFPNHVLTGRYASGFSNSLMAKDVQLYLRAVTDQDGPATVGAVTAAVWDAFATRDPGVDFTRIYPFVAQSQEDR